MPLNKSLTRINDSSKHCSLTHTSSSPTLSPYHSLVLLSSFHPKHFCPFPFSCLLPHLPFLLSLSLRAHCSPVDVLRPVICSSLSNIRLLLSFLLFLPSRSVVESAPREAGCPVAHVSRTQHRTVNTQTCAHLQHNGTCARISAQIFLQNWNSTVHARRRHTKSNTEACMSALSTGHDTDSVYTC